MSSVACSAGFASCKTFGKQPKHPCFGAEPPYRSSAICATASCSGFVWLTASILAWTRGGSPTLSPGTDAGRVCPNALCKDAYKWSNKVGAGRTDNKRPRLHRCRANQAYTALHHGEGVFGKDAEIRTHQALSTDAYKWSNKVGMQGCIKPATLSRCRTQRH